MSILEARDRTGGRIETLTGGDWPRPIDTGAEFVHGREPPVQDTLFFAGEATDLGGFCGTVHGALASGRRVADQLLRQRGRR